MRIAVQHRRTRGGPSAAHLRRIGRTLCMGLGLSNDSELSIVLTTDTAIQELNRTWRGKDRATDVLSFSQVEGDGARTHALGDVVISVETAARQAQSAGVPLASEVRRLLVHGVLHLVGHDHVHGGRQAKKMRAEERRLLRLLDRVLGP